MKRRPPIASLTAFLIVLVLFGSVTLIEKPAEAHLAVSMTPCSTLEADPVVEIVRSGNFNGITADSYAKTHYDDLIGTISNTNFYRFWDGTCGSYKGACADRGS